jgi:hypothetical protein
MPDEGTKRIYYDRDKMPKTAIIQQNRIEFMWYNIHVLPLPPKSKIESIAKSHKKLMQFFDKAEILHITKQQ